MPLPCSSNTVSSSTFTTAVAGSSVRNVSVMLSTALHASSPDFWQNTYSAAAGNVNIASCGLCTSVVSVLPTASSAQSLATYFTWIGTNCRLAANVIGIDAVVLNAYTLLKPYELTSPSTISTSNADTNVLLTAPNVTSTWYMPVSVNTTGAIAAPSVATLVTVVDTVAASLTYFTTSPTATNVGSSRNVSASVVTLVSHADDEMKSTPIALIATVSL